MNKVKVFKRKDVESAIHHTSEPANVPQNEEKVERRARRELVNTVSNWVNERREHRRSEELQSFRQLFGGGDVSLGEA